MGKNHKPPQPVGETEYAAAKQSLLAHLRGIKEGKDEPMFAFGDKVYSANQLEMEIEQDTDVGREHVRLHAPDMTVEQ